MMHSLGLAGWLPALALLIAVLLLARGRGFLLAYARAPIGTGMPLFLLVLFIAIPQMRGMMTATLGGVDGQGHYDSAWWHQVALPTAVFLLGLQGWYWSRAGLNARAGRRDSEQATLPLGERWSARLILIVSALLGVLPAYVVNGWHYPLSPEVPWVSVGLSVLFSTLLWLIILGRRSEIRVRRSLARPLPDPVLPGSLTFRLFACAPGGPLVAVSFLGAALVGIALAEGAPGLVDRYLHTATAVLLAAACYVPVATLWLTLLREGCGWVLERLGGPAPAAASSLGTALFILTPFAGSAVAVRAGLADVVSPRNSGTPPPGFSLDEASDAGCPGLVDRPPVIVAIAGGASRSAAWSLSAIRLLDIASDGRFSRQVRGFSTISGRSLGAVTYALARSQGGVQDAREVAFLEGAADLARSDLLPAVAFRLFSVDLLAGLPTRGPALAAAFDEFWQRNRAFRPRDPGPVSFASAAGDACQPLVILNGVDAKTGRRLLTSSLNFGDEDLLTNFAASRDLQRAVRTGFSASAAVLNSARFPIISPAGHIVLDFQKPRGTDGKDSLGTDAKDPLDKDAKDPLDAVDVIDGGTYEVSGISAALELADMMKAWMEQAGITRTRSEPILVIISNNGYSYVPLEDLEEPPATGAAAAVMPPSVTSPSVITVSADGPSAHEAAARASGSASTSYSAPPPDNLCEKLNPKTLEQGRKQVVAASGVEVPDVFNAVAGLNATRTTRYLAVLARARTAFCAGRHRDGGAGRLDRVFMLDLPEPPTVASGGAAPGPSGTASSGTGAKVEPVPMNWVLTVQDCSFMFGEARLSRANLDNAARLARLLDPASGLQPADLKRRLDSAPYKHDSDACRE